MIWIIIFFILSGLSVGYYTLICWRSHRLPGRPFTATQCLSGKIPADAKRVAVVGDSLTHGTMSHNWLVDLQVNFGAGYTFINMGTNGELAWNAFQRVDQVIECNPDIVAIFIGGNDVLASLSPIWADSFIQRKGLPQQPSVEWYQQNLEQIITALQKNTAAQLLLFTLTLYGEELDSYANQQMKAYSQIVEEMGRKFEVPVLPIHEKLRFLLTTRQIECQALPQPAADYHQYRRLIKLCLIRYHFLFQSWDQISKAHGFELLTDGAHLNSHAAGVITGTFKEWLEDQ